MSDKKLSVWRCPVHGGQVSETRPCREIVKRTDTTITHCHQAEEVEVIPVEQAERLREAAEKAMWEIDGLFKFFLVSGLSEEGGGLALYEQSKGLAEARASLAATLASLPDRTAEERG